MLRFSSILLYLSAGYIVQAPWHSILTNDLARSDHCYITSIALAVFALTWNKLTEKTTHQCTCAHCEKLDPPSETTNH